MALYSSAMNGEIIKTRVIPTSTSSLGQFSDTSLLTWELSPDAANSPQYASLIQAAKLLKTSNIPVAFPTETVYGLGADATRGQAVKGIYQAKGRPSDNPLIIHVCDLEMLHRVLSPASQFPYGSSTKSIWYNIPVIYHSLITRFWPGPLTILLPNPTPSTLAPEVTANLPSFGVRMPNSALALSLIKLAGVPIAAPSANASTKPSCTTAEHVLQDLDGKIELILDGGACKVGVESTIVDGLCNPPCILRPGGISMNEIRSCEGWEGCVKDYADESSVLVAGRGKEEDHATPRAPGMKYKHYSPKAKVVLYEPISIVDENNAVRRGLGIPQEVWKIYEARRGRISHLGYEKWHKKPVRIGIITTKHWKDWAGFEKSSGCSPMSSPDCSLLQSELPANSLKWDISQIQNLVPAQNHTFQMREGELWTSSPEHACTQREHVADVILISLGKEIREIAKALFSAFRELDERVVEVIYVEGVEGEGGRGDIAEAVMNRLRKAAVVVEKIGV